VEKKKRTIPKRLKNKILENKYVGYKSAEHNRQRCDLFGVFINS